jgi:prophage tail gpP-like protein
MASLPKPGSQYTVQYGDTLTALAQRAYGQASKWQLIYSANVLRSGNPDRIYPGEVFNIPTDPDQAKAQAQYASRQLQGKKREEATFTIAGKEVPIVTMRTLDAVDNLVSSWIIETDWIPGHDSAFDQATLPRKYPSSEIYIGSVLIGTGKLYTPKNKYTVDGRSKVLECFSLTADIEDSTLFPPYEFSGKLSAIAKKISSGLSITAPSDEGPAFDLVVATRSETKGDFLKRLAQQRGLLATTDEQGNLVFMRAVKSAPVGTIAEDETMVTEWEGAFDGRKFFNLYRAVGQSGDPDEIKSTAQDPVVPGTRQMTFSAGDVDAGQIPITAKWKRNHTYSESLSFPFPVRDWYDPQGTLWRKGTMVTVKSTTMGTPNGYTFYIKQVEYVLDGQGRRTTLSLVPIEALTGDDLKDPWS